MTDIHKVYENIRIHREMRGWSQENMAHMLDMSQSGFAKLESGKSPLSLDRLFDIAKIFNIEVGQLLPASCLFNNFENKGDAHANHHIGTFNTTSKEAYDQLVAELKDEINFLKELIRGKQT